MRVLAILFSFFLGSAIAQSNIKPFIKLGGAFDRFVYEELQTFDIGIAGGVHFNNYFSLQMGFNNMNSLTSVDILAFSISPSYRILKSKFNVSPVIDFEVGAQLWSNASGRFQGKGDFTFYLSEEPELANENGYFLRYNRGFFEKFKLLVDFKIKSFNLRIGPTFNLLFINYEQVKVHYLDYPEKGYEVISEFVDFNYGIGAELSLMYNFQMKKRVEKVGNGD